MASQDHQTNEPEELLSAEKAGKPPAPLSAGLVQIRHDFAGPLPPPSYLREYEEICPGMAERLLSMAEKQEAHRQSMEKSVTQGNQRAAEQNRIFAFIIVLTTLIFTGYETTQHQTLYGVALFLTELAALAGVFIYGTQSKKAERIQKEKIRAEARKALQKKRPSDTNAEDDS